MNKQQDLFDKIVALTKEIYFCKPADGTSRLQFHPGDGKTSRHFRATGIYVTWWFTKRTQRIIEDLVSIATDLDPDLRHGSRESLRDVVVNVFQENGFNFEIFDPDQIFLGRADTLFEARRIVDVQRFGTLLITLIRNALRASLSKWLVVFPLVRIGSKSWAVGHDGLLLIEPSDGTWWIKLAEQYRIDDWDPAIGGTSKASLKNSLKDIPFTWLGCEVLSGTLDSAREIAARKMRMFIAVLFARFYLTRKGILKKSMMHVTSYSVQFSAEDSKEPSTQVMASIGMLLPPLLSDFEIADNDVSQIIDWYARLQSSVGDKRDRITASAQFLNYAIVADGLERFVHFFISLDALFGVRGKVETTICDGLKNTFSTDPSWTYRASRLFDLRSTLVHGGCTSIEEWKELAAYRKHTASDPLKDVTDGAMKSFWEYLN